MHDELLRALCTLELAPGASWSDITARFRHLAKVWHPDKFLTPKEKAIAEQKLKQIIAAKELLQAHYQSGEHKTIGYCICWGRAPQPPPRAAPEQAPQAQSPFTKEPTDKPKTPWDWANDLASNLDLGPIKQGEPFWLETFRRLCDSILGKHPGDTALKYWEKAPAWTKDHKRRCLLWGFLLVVAIDRLVIATHATASVPPPTTVPGTAISPAISPAIAPASAPGIGIDPPADNSRTGIDFDSPEEIERERLYFDRKWKEREDMLQRIRPGYKPTGG